VEYHTFNINFAFGWLQWFGRQCFPKRDIYTPQIPANKHLTLHESTLIYDDRFGVGTDALLDYNNVINGEIFFWYTTAPTIPFTQEGSLPNGWKIGRFVSNASNAATYREALETLLNTPNILGLEPHYAFKTEAADPARNVQWADDTLNYDLVHKHYTGDGVVVAVIDTGIDLDHPDLRNNLWRNTKEIPDNGIDDDQNGYIDDIYGYDFINNDASPEDDNAHGSHCAGIIAATKDNGLGLAGLAPESRIMALKALDRSGAASSIELFYAILYAVDEGAQIINASFGGYGYSYLLHYALHYAQERGVSVVAAAGNESHNNDTAPYFYPASLPLDNIISVAATTSQNSLASFSNYGKTSVDIAAPGHDIYSTVMSGYNYFSGTSMAAPHVAGAIALLREKTPSISFASIRTQLMQTASHQSTFQASIASGQLDLKALFALSDEEVTEPTTPEPTPQDPLPQIPKSITSITPEPNAKNVSLGAFFEVIVSLELDLLTIIKTKFILYDGDETPIEATLSYANRTFKLTPKKPLNSQETYKIHFELPEQSQTNQVIEWYITTEKK